MFFEWNEQILQWLLDASDYTGYNRKLAAMLRRYITPGGTLCDMGCGMALVDFELAPMVRELTCVDISPFAISFVEAEARRRGLDSLHALCCDGQQADGEWDTVMALFHGTVELICEGYLRRAKKQFILVTHGAPEGQTGPEGYRVRKCDDVKSTAAWLESKGLRYELERGSLEFGQPHRSFADALEYTRAFSRKAPEELLEAHVRSKITQTGRADFPLYTPKTRDFGIFVIRREDNANFF